MYCLRKRSKEICIGHRLYNYKGPCSNVHGHGITVELELVTPAPLVVDYDQLNSFLSSLDRMWDHGFIVWDLDKEMHAFLKQQQSKHYVIKENPTMEALAREIFDVIVMSSQSWSSHLKKVRVFEKAGKDNMAEYSVP